MKERPILFSGAMVRAILEGRKTQTRLVVKPQPEFTGAAGDSFEWHGGKALERVGYGAAYVHTDKDAMIRAMLAVCPYGEPGDRLWVRETFRIYNEGIDYKAGGSLDYTPIEANSGQMEESEAWRPSIHMPRWASRLTLEIVSVRVERLQDITPDDCRAEGQPKDNNDIGVRYGFGSLWDSINRKRPDCAWSDNPWVWVVGFRRIEQ